MKITFDALIDGARGGCDVVGCDHASHGNSEPMFIHARCHPRARLSVCVVPAKEVMEIRCGECRAIVAEVGK
jgi:alpha-beta hydrolase superfamily lysophospholipase